MDRLKQIRQIWPLTNSHSISYYFTNYYFYHLYSSMTLEITKKDRLKTGKTPFFGTITRIFNKKTVFL